MRQWSCLSRFSEQLAEGFLFQQGQSHVFSLGGKQAVPEDFTY